MDCKQLKYNIKVYLFYLYLCQITINCVASLMNNADLFVSTPDGLHTDPIFIRLSKNWKPQEPLRKRSKAKRGLPLVSVTTKITLLIKICNRPTMGRMRLILSLLRPARWNGKWEGNITLTFKTFRWYLDVLENLQHGSNFRTTCRTGKTESF
jgi:hypothetical protein